MLDYDRLIRNLCNQTSSTWVSEDTLLSYFKKYGGRIEDLEEPIKQGLVVKFENLYSIPYFSDMENRIAAGVMRLMFAKPCPKVPEAIIRSLVGKFEAEENGGRKLHCNQVNAVIMVVNENFSILTGGPGTGKTTVLSAITYVLRKLHPNISIVFTAPTGRASKRISESTGENASTLHKKLGISFEKTNPDRFYEDVLFIDESSMNDIILTDTLFAAVKEGKKIVFVGDIDQLPSVGPGAVLRDLIRSKVVPVTMLTHTFRQDNSSMLYQNIVNVREGKAEIVEGDDFHAIKFLKNENRQNIILCLLEQYKKSIEKYGIENVCVLVPYRKSGICSNFLNTQLQKIANHETWCYKHTHDNNTIFFKKGDMVMQLENRDECANGDVGTVTEVSEKGVEVTYTDDTVLYSVDELSQLALAYSITINKSQGSEYPCVIMLLLDEHTAMHNRNILYTGITRTKKECILLYQQEAYEKSLKTKADSKRITLLTEKLRDCRMQIKAVYGF